MPHLNLTAEEAAGLFTEARIQIYRTVIEPSQAPSVNSWAELEMIFKLLLPEIEKRIVE